MLMLCPITLGQKMMLCCSCVLLLEGGEDVDVGVDIYMFSNFRVEMMLMYMVYPVTLGWRRC